MSNNEYVMAGLSPNKLSKLSETDRLKAMVLCINEVYKFRGQQPNAEDSVDMARNLCRKISTIEGYEPSIEDVRLAFENGVTGEYGEYFGISYVTLWKWFKTYIYSSERLNAINEYFKNLPPQTTNILSEKTATQMAEDERRAQIEMVHTIHSEILTHGYADSSYHKLDDIYQFLRNEGIMQRPEQSEIDAARKQAEDVLERRKESRSMSLCDRVDYGLDSNLKLTEAQKVHYITRALLLVRFLKGHKEKLSFNQ